MDVFYKLVVVRLKKTAQSTSIEGDYKHCGKRVAFTFKQINLSFGVVLQCAFNIIQPVGTHPVMNGADKIARQQTTWLADSK